MTTRVLLLRHAMTSAPEYFHGSESDVGLGETGRQQALAAAEAIRALRPHAVIASTMRRAIETARPIADACGLPLVTVPDLHERRMGPLSGTTWDASRAIYDGAARDWMCGDLDSTHEGGESYREIRDRVVPAFLGLARRYEGRTIAVILHGVVIRVLLTSLVEGFSVADYQAISIEHVKVYELTHRGPWPDQAAEPSEAASPPFFMASHSSQE